MLRNAGLRTKIWGLAKEIQIIQGIESKNQRTTSQKQIQTVRQMQKKLLGVSFIRVGDEAELVNELHTIFVRPDPLTALGGGGDWQLRRRIL